VDIVVPKRISDCSALLASVSISNSIRIDYSTHTKLYDGVGFYCMYAGMNMSVIVTGRGRGFGATTRTRQLQACKGMGVQGMEEGNVCAGNQVQRV